MYEHLDAAGWQRVAQAAQAFPAPQPDPCLDLRQQLAAAQAQVQAQQAVIAAALGQAQQLVAILGGK